MMFLSTFMRQTWCDCREALAFVGRWFLSYGLWALLALGIGAVLAVVWLLPADDTLLAAMQPSERESQDSLRAWARQISYYGDFAGFNLVLFVGLQVAGRLMKSRRLVRIAIASLLCAGLTGLTANIIRSTTGRPRPYTHLPDVLHGPSFSSKYQSLPSAHTATSFGGALPVLLTLPAVGAPLTVAAASVGWSRMQLERHHPTDVLASILLALMFSLPLSRWAMLEPLPLRSPPTDGSMQADHAPIAPRPPH
jgi:membrane-associated phospholipid phosphatase